MSYVFLNIPYFPDAKTGRPVFNGYIYIGEPDTDPEIEVNQKPVSLILEDQSVVLVAQPIRTGAGGVPVHNGAAVQIMVDGSHSLKVLNNKQEQVYYLPANSPVVGVGVDNNAITFLYNQYYNQVSSEYQAADASIITNYQAADVVVTDGYQAADANIQAQLTGNVPLEASAFSPISWHEQVVQNSVIIPENKNAWSFGPTMSIEAGAAVTIPAGSFWTIANGEVNV